jgi:hypothetical protein
MKAPLHIRHLEPDRKDAGLVRAALDAGVAFLSKPYTPATLACKAREMLDIP